jgi:hypothetical protein
LRLADDIKKSIEDVAPTAALLFFGIMRAIRPQHLAQTGTLAAGVSPLAPAARTSWIARTGMRRWVPFFSSRSDWPSKWAVMPRPRRIRGEVTPV